MFITSVIVVCIVMVRQGKDIDIIEVFLKLQEININNR
jgi:hypothetical protein